MRSCHEIYNFTDIGTSPVIGFSGVVILFSFLTFAESSYLIIASCTRHTLGMYDIFSFSYMSFDWVRVYTQRADHGCYTSSRNWRSIRNIVLCSKCKRPDYVTVQKKIRRAYNQAFLLLAEDNPHCEACALVLRTMHLSSKATKTVCRKNGSMHLNPTLTRVEIS